MNQIIILISIEFISFEIEQATSSNLPVSWIFIVAVELWLHWCEMREIAIVAGRSVTERIAGLRRICSQLG